MFTTGFLKIASPKKHKRRQISSDEDKGYVNAAQLSTMESENKPLYPAPNTMQNVSGSDKVAFAMPKMPAMKAPAMKAPVAPKLKIGPLGGAKSMSTPARVTPTIKPLNPPPGATGVLGTSFAARKREGFGHFGHNTRKGLKSPTNLKRGM